MTLFPNRGLGCQPEKFEETLVHHNTYRLTHLASHKIQRFRLNPAIHPHLNKKCHVFLATQQVGHQSNIIFALLPLFLFLTIIHYICPESYRSHSTSACLASLDIFSYLVKAVLRLSHPV